MPPTSRWPCPAHRARASPRRARQVAEVETPERRHDRRACAVPGHRCAHHRQGDARRGGRRQGLARARARRPPPARAQAQQGAAPDHRRRPPPEQIEAAFGARPGSIGPVGIRRTRSAASSPTRRCARARWVDGREPHRLAPHRASRPRRDFEAVFADLHEVEDGDGCAFCDGVLSIEPMIEIGNIFKLGTRFSRGHGGDVPRRERQPSSRS